MNKLQIFLRLKGVNKQDNSLIQIEKRKYIYNRLIRLFSKKIPIYTMGLGLSKPVIADTGDGLFYCRQNSFDLHIISSSYEMNIRNIIKKLAKKSDIIIDIGANVGKYSVLAGKTNPHAKIYSIEPQKDNFEILSKNIGLNNLKNVELIKIALGDKKDKVKLYEGANIKNFGGYSVRNETNVFEIAQLNTFDNLFKKEIARADLVKIDTEGFELQILKGMKLFLSRKWIKNIILEIDKENYLEVKMLFDKYGYVLKYIMYNNYLARSN